MKLGEREVYSDSETVTHVAGKLLDECEVLRGMSGYGQTPQHRANQLCGVADRLEGIVWLLRAYERVVLELSEKEPPCPAQ